MVEGEVVGPWASCRSASTLAGKGVTRGQRSGLASGAAPEREV